jgi:transcription elongation factor GreB
VSKAFTDEETAEPPRFVPPRAPLPPGVPNYVTARGLALLRTELDALAGERARAERELPEPERAPALAALAQRRAELEDRIASAELVRPPAEPTDTVRFGAVVTVAGAAGERRYRIVGVDEADAAQGRIAFVAPLARALLGRAAGDSVRVRLPRGEDELEILAVRYDDDDVEPPARATRRRRRAPRAA